MYKLTNARGNLAPSSTERRKQAMKLGLWIAILWVVAGILVLIFPTIINWLLGIALIAVGVLTFFRK